MEDVNLDTLPDDVMALLLSQLATEFSGGHEWKSPSSAAAAAFVWYRTTLPLVCRRWARALAGPSPAWATVIVDVRAETAHARRMARAGGGGGGSPRGSSPGPVLGGPPRRSQDLHRRSVDSAPSPLGGASPLGGSPIVGGTLLRHSASSGRVRALLRGDRVCAWLAPRAAAICEAVVDVSTRPGAAHDLQGGRYEGLLGLLRRTRRLVLVGAPDGHEGFEALGGLRQLQSLAVLSAPQSFLEGGLLAACFLPQLRSLTVGLDIAPASAGQLRHMPPGLEALSLINMCLRDLPLGGAHMAGLRTVALQQCSVGADPAALLKELLALPALHSATLVACSGSAGGQWPSAEDAWRGDGGGGGGSSAGPGPGGVAGAAGVTSLRLQHTLGLSGLPAGLVSSLPGLRVLDLSDNFLGGVDTEAGPGPLPDCLDQLPSLGHLCLAHCGLRALPPVVTRLSALTQLELQGNGMASLPRGVPRFADTLRALDLSGSCLASVPPLVLHCTALTRLTLGASCLAGAPGSAGAAAAGADASGSGGTHPGACGEWPSGLPQAGWSASTTARLWGAGGAAGSGSAASSTAGAPTGRVVRFGRSTAPAPAAAMLPAQLPRLRLLRVEGATYDVRAVEALMAMAHSLGRGSSLLSIELVAPG